MQLVEFGKRLLLLFFFAVAFALLYQHIYSIFNPNIRYFNIHWRKIWSDAVKDVKTAPLIWLFCIAVIVFVIITLWDDSRSSEITILSDNITGLSNQIQYQTQILEQIRDSLNK
jgi:hypothetical protein